MEYMDKYVKRTQEEIDREDNKGGKRTKGGDPTKRPTINLTHAKKDIMFGIFANVIGQNFAYNKVPFNKYESGLPAKQSNQPLILRCLWTSYDYLTPNKIQDDIVVGGIVDLQMYAFPEICKQTAQKWVLRTVLPLDERLKKLHFPDPTLAVQDTTPVEIIFTLPETVYTSDDTSQIKIAVWDKENDNWSSEDIGDNLEFKKSTSQITFTTQRFAPMALLQSRCTDYPYQNWWLRCVDNELAILTIWTKRGIKLIFEIGQLYLKLTSKEMNEPELKHLVD